MDYLFQYLLFLGETLTVVVALLVVIAFVVSMGMRQQRPESGHLEVRSVNDRFEDMRATMESVVLPAADFKKRRKEEKKERKKRDKGQADPRPRVFVLDFDGDMQASDVEHFRKEVTGVLQEVKEGDEVLVRLESPGGMVHSYGLAASQMARLKAGGVQLVAAVDRVAASGGYLMACLAHRIIAAPFAVIGSIGVIAQVPNVHRLLKQNHIDVDILTAGEFKRTLTVFGENTDKGRAKFIEELEDTHAQFKEHVAEHRPSLDIDAVATGEAWHGARALGNGLIDELKTSDEYLLERAEAADIYEVRWEHHRTPVERVLDGVGVRISERVVALVTRLASPSTWKF